MLKAVALHTPGLAGLVRERDALRLLLLGARTEREEAEAALREAQARFSREAGELEQAARLERERAAAMLSDATDRLSRETGAREAAEEEARQLAARLDEAVSEGQARLERATERARLLEGELEGARQRAEALEGQLEGARQRAEALQDQLDDAHRQAEAASATLQAMRASGPVEYRPAEGLIGGLRFSRPAQVEALLQADLFARRAVEHQQALLANLDNPGPLATFLRGYMGLEAGTGEALRFALVVELVLQLAGDSWIDLGSFGHDAAYISALRPDIRARLFSYQGGRVGIYPDGYRYVDGGRPAPAASAWVEPLDFEAEPLPVESGSVSLVTAFEVFEHFKFGPQHCMGEVNRVLAPGGRLVLTVPNAASAGAVWKLLHAEHPALCSLYHRDPRLGRIHPSEYVASQLRGLVEAFGFRVDVLTGYTAGDYSLHERLAIGWCHAGNFRGASVGDDDLGASLLLAATKVDDVRGTSYPESLFERA